MNEAERLERERLERLAARTRPARPIANPQTGRRMPRPVARSIAKANQPQDTRRRRKARARILRVAKQYGIPIRNPKEKS